MSVTISVRIDENVKDEIEQLGYKPSEYIKNLIDKEIKKEKAKRALSWIRKNRLPAGEKTVEEEIQKIASASALGRMGEPDEFGRSAAFLLSPAVSYITGVMLTIDGGMYKGTM